MMELMQIPASVARTEKRSLAILHLQLRPHRVFITQNGYSVCALAHTTFAGKTPLLNAAGFFTATAGQLISSFYVRYRTERPLWNRLI